ncbi:hypothetical protein M8J75_012484 [Diaphorina citri]|nr:hypothetical protein M8J75_012484 [Diaphorina citri]
MAVQEKHTEPIENMARNGVYSFPNNVFSSMDLNEIQSFTPSSSKMECGDHDHPASKKLLVIHTVRGIVKFYDSKRGFGFITRLDNKEDIFVHKSSIVKMNPKKFFQSLGLGEIVDFNIGVGKKDIEAINVTGPNGIPVQGAPKVP